MTSAFQQLRQQHRQIAVDPDRLGDSFTFQSNAAEDITFDGVFDDDTTKSKPENGSTKDECDAKLHCVAAEKFDAMVAAVPDFEKDGWIAIHGDKYSIVGTCDRDDVSVTLKLALSKLKTFRSPRRK